MSWKTLDELQWSDPAAAEEMQGIHSNSVLFYFMRSPYFDKTSNNNTVYNQALHNASMFPVLATRERFEDFLRSMSGVEYVVHQAPAEMAPGTGTGVWVIRKQLRRKRSDVGLPDDLTVYADYFVVGYNIYQAPTLADLLSARITSMAVSLSKAFPAMNSMQTWSPARGHVYETKEDDEDDDEDEEEDDDDSSASEKDVVMGNTGQEKSEKSEQKPSAPKTTSLDPRLAEESYALHMMYGGDYMDEQVVSGRPGDFHVTNVATGKQTSAATSAADTAAAAAAAKEAVPATTTKGGKSKKDKDATKKPPVSGTSAPKPKRRKSKGPSAA